MDKHHARQYYTQAAQQDENLRRATPDAWKHILTPVATKHGCLPGDPAEAVAKRLYERHPQAVYRLLKDDEVGGRAFRACC
ncbi:MAG: hypothetical protein R3C99_08785 [Pirellulaceae bacterium]